MNTTIALGVIDTQRGFMPADEGARLEVSGFGELPVPQGERIVPKLNQLIGEFALRGFDVFFTQDWHPEQTAHFATQPNYVTTWPTHCVENTPGAELHPELVVPDGAGRFKKGNEVLAAGEDDTSYTGYNGINETGETLGEWLKARRVTEVVLGGLALDYCVKATAIDLQTKAGLAVTLVVDATEPVTQETGLTTIDELEKLGVKFVTTEEYLEKLKARGE